MRDLHCELCCRWCGWTACYTLVCALTGVPQGHRENSLLSLEEWQVFVWRLGKHLMNVVYHADIVVCF